MAPLSALNYRRAIVREATVGPRRELSLAIEIWPEGRHTFALGDGEIVRLRFGAIVNYEEVRKFFSTVPMEGLHYLREAAESKAGRRVVEMQFNRTEAGIRITAGTISINAKKPTAP